MNKHQVTMLSLTLPDMPLALQVPCLNYCTVFGTVNYQRQGNIHVSKYILGMEDKIIKKQTVISIKMREIPAAGDSRTAC